MRLFVHLCADLMSCVNYIVSAVWTMMSDWNISVNGRHV